METRRRYLEPAIARVLPRKMIFSGGPRQVGKTTLALSLLGAGADETHPAYFNWDDPRSAARVRRLELPPGEPLLVLDEIHKYARWRNLVKGIHDTEKSRRRIVVTGSARLDYYRKGGDSLAGRYRYFRLHLFSLRELNAAPTKSDLDALLHFGGFPEPLLQQDEREHRIWRRRARGGPRHPLFRRVHLDSAFFSGPPRRPPLRNRADNRHSLSNVLL